MEYRDHVFVLNVRQWTCCVCGTHHDRDVNSARNAIIVGLGWSHEVSYVKS
jgi:putative transposase